jgi:hypothetical protein
MNMKDTPRQYCEEKRFIVLGIVLYMMRVPNELIT